MELPSLHSETVVLVEKLERVSSSLKRFLDISKEDLDRIREIPQVISEHFDRIINEAVDVLLSDDEARNIATRVGLSRESASKLLKLCLANTFSEDVGYKLSLKVSKVGLAHCKAGVSGRLFSALLGVLLVKITEVLLNRGRGDLIPSLQKGAMWTLGIVDEAYLMAVMLSMEKTTGIKRELLDKSVMLSADKVYDEVSKKLVEELGGGE